MISTIYIKALTSKIGNQFSINIQNKKVCWGDIKILQFRKNAQNSVFYKTNYEADQFDEILVNRSNRRGVTESNRGNIELQKAYTGPLSVSKKKKDGLLSLCQKNTTNFTEICQFPMSQEMNPILNNKILCLFIT